MKRTVVALAALAAGLSATICRAQANGEIRFRLADRAEGRRLISAKDAYTGRITPNDVRLKLGRDGATVEDYLSFAAEQVEDFPESSRTALSNSFARLNKRFAALGFESPVTNEIVIVGTTLREEFGAAGYTRGSTIYLNAGMVAFAPKRSLDILVAHELFHVLSRESPDFRRRMYAVIGFTLCEEPAFGGDVRRRILANPDVEKYDCKATFTIDGKPTEATIVSYLPDPSIPGRRALSEVRAGVVPIGMPDRIIPADDVPDFWSVVGRNTDYVIAAEECLADNFSFAVVLGKKKRDLRKFPDGAIIKGILAALGAENPEPSR